MRRFLTAPLLALLLALSVYAAPPVADIAEQKSREVSPEGREYLAEMRERAPFGDSGFDLEKLRAGMGSRRAPTIKDVRLIPVKVEGIPCEWVLAPGADPDVRLLYLHGMFHVFQSREPLLPEAREAIDHAAHFIRTHLPPK